MRAAGRRCRKGARRGRRRTPRPRAARRRRSLFRYRRLVWAAALFGSAAAWLFLFGHGGAAAAALGLAGALAGLALAEEEGAP